MSSLPHFTDVSPPRFLPMVPELKGTMGRKQRVKQQPPYSRGKRNPFPLLHAVPCPLPRQRALLQHPVYENLPPNRHLCTPSTAFTEKHAPDTRGASIATMDKSGMLKSSITPADIESPWTWTAGDGEVHWTAKWRTAGYVFDE